MIAVASGVAAVMTGVAGAEKVVRSGEWEPRPCEETWWQSRQGREALVERLLHTFTDLSAGGTRDKTRRRGLGTSAGVDAAVEQRMAEHSVRTGMNFIYNDISIEPRLLSGSFRLPHLGDWTHEGQPLSQRHSEMSRSASPTSASKRSNPARVMPTPPGWPS